MFGTGMGVEALMEMFKVSSARCILAFRVP